MIKKCMIKRMIQNHHQRGFTLLEVMVTVLVLSIGLLGVAALQVIGLRSNHGAYLSSQAAILAYDMADRIRANAGVNNSIAAQYRIDCANLATPANALAAADVADWCDSLARLLPLRNEEGDNLIGGMGNQFTIRVTWQDAQVEGGADPWNFELTIQL